MSLNMGSRIFAECSFSPDTPMYARSSLGGYLLGMTLHLKVVQSEKNERILTNLSGQLLWETPSTFIADVCSTETFDVRSNPRIEVTSQLHLQTVFSRENLESIESLRNGGDVRLSLKLLANLVGTSDSEDQNIFAVRLTDEVRIKIEQSEWIKLLNSWNFDAHLLLEVAISNSAPEQLRRAHDCLKKAQLIFFQGNWEQSIAECRKSLEAIAFAIDKDANLTGMLNNKRFNSLKDRCLTLALAAKEICHLASHSDEVATKTSWSKKDAELMLHQAAICLRTFS